MSTYFYTQPPAQTGPLKQRGAAGKGGGKGTRLSSAQWGQQDDLSVGGSEADSDAGEVVLTGVHPDVYGSCLVLTVRGLYDKKMGSIFMAWVWVALVLFLNLCIIWTLHTYINRDSAANYGSRSKVEKVIWRLNQSLVENIPLNTTSQYQKLDKHLIDLCAKQPSGLFFFVVHFIWSARMMGQLSEARSLLYCMTCCPVRKSRDQTIEDQNDTIVLAGLLPFDALLFTLGLVLPKTIVAVLLWYVGTELLSLTRDLAHLLLKAVTLHYVSVIEQEVFNNFLAHSKKEWIMNAQIAQVHGTYFSLAVSWPGEVLKLLSTLSLVYAARIIFHTEALVRTLCFKCVHTCPLKCSHAFDFCFKLVDWPYNYHA